MGLDIETYLADAINKIQRDIEDMKIDIAVIKSKNNTKAVIWGGVFGSITLLLGATISFILR